MSTILKSLKKLEKEKEGQNPYVPAPALITGAGTHQAIHRSLRFAWLRGRILQWSIIGAGCLVLFAIVLYAFSRPSPSKPEAAAAPKASVQSVPKGKSQGRLVNSAPLAVPSASVQATEPETIAVPKSRADEIPPAVSVLSAPVAQRPDTEPVAPARPVAPPLAKDGFEALGQKPAPSTMGAVPVKERLPQPTPQPASAATPKPKPKPSSDGVSEESLSGETAPVEPKAPAAGAPIESDAPTAAPQEKASAPTQPRAPTQATPSRHDEAAFAGAERLTDGSLKVQAIVFAPTAEERMAVVNNTIVREGSAIDRYTIVGIGEENVFVREGQGRLLKVPFGKP